MCIVFELEERIAKSQIFLLQEAVLTLDTFQMERLSACPNWHELLKYLLVVCRFRIAWLSKLRMPLSKQSNLWGWLSLWSVLTCAWSWGEFKRLGPRLSQAASVGASKQTLKPVHSSLALSMETASECYREKQPMQTKKECTPSCDDSKLLLGVHYLCGLVMHAHLARLHLFWQVSNTLYYRQVSIGLQASLNR